MKKLVLSAFFILAISLLSAHEFWLAPDKYFYNIRDIALIRFRVGENFTGDNWGGNKERIKQFIHYLPDGSKADLSDRLSMQKGDSARIPLQMAGTHMVTFNSTNSKIELDAEKFTDYLKEDGLESAIAYRSKYGETGKKGREFYQRSVKTIIQVGSTLTDACTKPCELPLDIIPFENPYTPPGIEPRGNLLTVRFKVLFKGKTLANQLVKIWYKDEQGIKKMTEYRTNNRGIISAKRYSGPFMVSTVYMERLSENPDADWQSYWASLNFEYSSFYSSGR